MAGKKTVKKTEEPKGVAAPGKRPVKAPVKADEGRAAVVKKLLKKLEQQMGGGEMKASLGDYFAHDGLGTNYSGMPFYDAWNQSEFTAQYSHPMAVIAEHTVDPANYPDEVEYLPTVIGNFTTAIMNYVRASYPDCRFEVLYPTDVNQTAFNRAVNYPAPAWTPSSLTCLKTESFGFTLGRDLDKCWETLEYGTDLGFGAGQRAHLVGIGDATTAWPKEALAAAGKRFESVVLFALDQFCLIGYELPLPGGLRRSFRSGI
jgi:hypothetical protein